MTRPRFFELRIVVLREHAGQRPPARRRVAQAEALGGLARDAAALEVVDGLGRCLEVLAVGVACLLQHVGEGGLFLLLRGLALALGGADVVLRHLQADLAGKILHGFDEAHAGMVHQKADGVAILAAAKAVIELLAGTDGEGGRLLAVERAQAHEVGAALPELHVASHDIDHVDAREQFLDERLGNGHPRIVPSRGHPAVPRGHWPAVPGPQPRRWKVSVKATPSRVLCALIVPPIFAI